MREAELIDRIASATRLPRADVALGIGDDGAVLRVPSGRELVAVVDTLVAGVHFPARTAPEAVGWKAIAVNLSDLAAMGAQPAWATLALTLPHAEPVFVDAFARGFSKLARLHRVALVGGDTTRGPLSITVQAQGFVARGHALRRDAARVGDVIVVSGTLGDAAAGLALAQRRLRAAPRLEKQLRARLDRPTPRVALGLALAAGASRCAIDVSDGLARDLDRVLAASRVGAEIDAEALPHSEALGAAVGDVRARLALQLTGGDDYELCFTVPERAAGALRSIARRAGVALTPIGRITRRRGLRLRGEDGKARPLAPDGFDHFG